MESKNKLKDGDIKNHVLLFFYIMRVWDVDFSDILLHEKFYKEKFENILIDRISYKTSTTAKPLRICYRKIEGFSKIQDRIRYLVLIDCVSLPIEKILTFHNVTIPIKSAVNKNKNGC